MTIAERYFCTAPHLVRPFLEEGPVMRMGLLHAKTMGTTRTACGLDASGWPKLWEVEFPSAGPDLCPVCAREVPCQTLG